MRFIPSLNIQITLLGNLSSPGAHPDVDFLYGYTTIESGLIWKGDVRLEPNLGY